MSHHPLCHIEKAKQIVSACLKVQEHFHKAAEKGHPSGKQCYNCTKNKKINKYSPIPPSRG